MYNEMETRDLMKKNELLSPAGSYESAIAAIQNGCDAIYLGGTHFGARAFANNFTEQQIHEIVSYAHAYGVLVYITLNTLIHDHEYEQCIDYIKNLYELKIDALIIQDLGVLSYVRKNYPDFEVHSSTQTHICNKEAILFLKEEGVSRAVLAREVPIEEIKKLSILGIDLEVFVHGALCVSYSGQCLMSYMIGGRSGNRGECAQSCRMPYTLCNFNTKQAYGDSGYLLSLKDLNTLAHVKELKEAGISSFKIEGRMKKSEYVGYITHLYRCAMDDENFQLDNSQLEKAKLLFHRGYTDGFLYSQKGSNLYNPFRPNHLGISLGKVLSSNADKIKVQLENTLYQGDGVRILQEKEDFGFKVNRIFLNGLLVNHANQGSIVEIECYENAKKGSMVLKTSDPKLEKEIRNDYEKIKRRISIQMNLEAYENEKLKLSISDEKETIIVYSEVLLERAKTQELNKADIEEKLRKVKETIFEIKSLDIEVKGNPFIPVKILNELRRDALQKLYERRCNAHHRTLIPYQEKELTPMYKDVNISVKVINEEQLLYAIERGISSIYLEDRDLFNKYRENTQILLCSNRVEKQGYHDVSVIQDIGGIYACSNYITDTSLNVTNAHSAAFLVSKGAKLVCASWEMDSESILNMSHQLKQEYQLEGILQVIVYGRCEVMVSEHCPINAHLSDNDKHNCTICRKQTYALKDKFNNEYPMNNDNQCRMHLYDCKIRDDIEKIPMYLKHKVAPRFNFTFESVDEMKKILDKVIG